MSLTTGEMSAADLAAVVGNSNGNSGNDGFGSGNGWWIILLFLCLFGNGGWGGNGNGGYGGGNGGNSGNGGFVPYYLANNTDNGVQAGFNNAAIAGQLNGIQGSISDLSSQLCSCCCDMRDTVNQGFYGAEVAANSRQMANMNTAFAAQTAMNAGFNALQSTFADCCCENRLANCQTQNIIQNEGNATRFADANNTRDIIQSQTSGTQLILDKLCQLELDAKNDKINDLERQLTMANLAASQTAQTARLERNLASSNIDLLNELRSCPIPSQPVYGSQPIFTCPNNNNGCGCGCGSF